MNRFFYICILSVFLLNCTSNTIINKPDDLIPKDQMVEIISDLLVANGAENVKNLQEKRKINYFPFVFNKHKIDSTQFKKSNFYYTTRIDDYDEILNEVDIRLKKLKKNYEQERKTRDSLKKAEREKLKVLKRLTDKDGRIMIDPYYNVHIPFLKHTQIVHNKYSKKTTGGKVLKKPMKK